MADHDGYTPPLLQPDTEPAGGMSLHASEGLDPVLSPPECAAGGAELVRETPRLVRDVP